MRRALIAGAATASLIFGSSPAWAAGAGALPSDLSLWWGAPFAGLLLSIAVLPAAAPHFWHAHYGKIALFWAAAFLIPCVAQFGGAASGQEVAAALLLEYIPFMALVATLYVVAGGVRLAGALPCTPKANAGLLLLGTAMASVMGTTGAAMLLIRPLLEANKDRRHKTHVFVFFIFLVANIGGGLTPIGDPPLFIGFLRGVEFFWFAEHMALPVLGVSGALLGIFYALDRYFWAQEAPALHDRQARREQGVLLRLEGLGNLALIAAAVAAVLISGVWRPGIDLHPFGVTIPLQDAARSAALFGILGLSLALPYRRARKENGFDWFPVAEVGKLFAAIFITIIPCLVILKAGPDGALAAVTGWVNPGGAPDAARYFWLTGALSAFLDNAPTFLVFFEAAGGDPAALMGPLGRVLLAISAGAVFFGAATYIGNAPNFMVKSVVERSGVAMPGFFGFMLWSLAVLCPVFALFAWIRF